jgi:hypothetical protein
MTNVKKWAVVSGQWAGVAPLNFSGFSVSASGFAISAFYFPNFCFGSFAFPTKLPPLAVSQIILQKVPATVPLATAIRCARAYVVVSRHMP